MEEGPDRTRFRILLPDLLLPVQAYLNVWPDSEFLPMLRRMAEGVESTYNDTGWSWWGGEVKPPPPRGRVLFWLLNEEIEVSAEEAIAHIGSALNAWLTTHPDHRTEALEVMDRIGIRLRA